MMLALSMFGALANTHDVLHVIDGSAAIVHPHEAGHGDAHSPTAVDASVFDQFLHGLAHACHCCSVTMSAPLPVVKLLLVPRSLIPVFYARPAPSPSLQSLFRPPIR